MAVEERQEDAQQAQPSEDAGKGTALKAAAAAAATSVAALAAKKAFSHRGSSGGSRNGGTNSSSGDAGSVISSVLSGGWDAARDALIPAAEDAAGAVGEYLAENGPDIVRERIVPRFIESFNEARGS
jgi:hypothetical protein